VDAWLLERLAGTYVTDAATASRTMLLDLESTTWSDEACSLFELDPGSLREIVDCDAAIGETDAFGGTLPVTCRIHMSFWDKDGSQSTFPGDDPHEPSDVFRQVLAGLTGSMRELTMFLAPTSTRTNASRPRAGLRRRSRTGATTAPAGSALSGTEADCGSSRVSRAPMRTRISRSRR
jgi:hypothetical protein